MGDSGEGKSVEEGGRKSGGKDSRAGKLDKGIKRIDRNPEHIKKTQATSQSAEAHSNTNMWAEINEVVMAETLEEKQLWKERARLEKRVERKEKMIQNTRARVKSGWVIGEEQTLHDEAEEIQREVDDIREEITVVDRRIRRAERDGLGSDEKEAKAIELAAKEAKEDAYGLEQARQKKKEAEETIEELETKLKEGCRA